MVAHKEEKAMSDVVIRSTKGRSLDEVVHDLLTALDWHALIPAGGSVVIKLNLNTPDQERAPSANTTPELVAALCTALKERSRRITLVEAHSYRATAEEAFENSGIYEVAHRVGVDVVNLSSVETRDVGNPVLGPLPAILLDADAFITMPVVKTHALTYFTGSLKNQWGCVPRFDRIALHYALDELLVELNGILKPCLSIMDGIVGVEGRGPTNGKPRRLDLVLASRDPVALDAAAMRLVGLDPRKCQHVVMAYEAGQGKLQAEDIVVSSDIEGEISPFEPAKLDWAVDWMNRLTRYPFFRESILGVDAIFRPTKWLVGRLRTLGIVR